MKKNTNKKLRARIAEVIHEVEAATALGDISNVLKLEGYKDAYRIRIGNYRLGFLFDGETVVFARFLHRKDIYRQFP